MKIKVIILSLFTFGLSLNAQKDSIPAKDSVKLDNIFVGLLANTDCPLRGRFKVKTAQNFRVGAGATWSILPKSPKTDFDLSVKSWAFVDVTRGTDNTLSGSGNMMLGLIIHTDDGSTASVGNIPTTLGTIRPLPITDVGQFELWTTSQIPGVAPGFAMSFGDESFRISSGLFSVDGEAHLQGKVRMGTFSIGGYFGGNPNIKHLYGAVTGIENEDFSIWAVATDSLYGLQTFVRVSEKHNIYFYTDTGMDHTKYYDGEVPNKDKLVRFEVGIQKAFDLKPLKGTISGAYNYEEKAFRTYLHIFFQ